MLVDLLKVCPPVPGLRPHCDLEAGGDSLDLEPPGVRIPPGLHDVLGAGEARLMAPGGGDHLVTVGVTRRSILGSDSPTKHAQSSERKIRESQERT